MAQSKNRAIKIVRFLIFAVYMLSFTTEIILDGASSHFQSSLSPERANIPTIRPPLVPAKFRLPSQHPSQTPSKREILGLLVHSC